MAARSRDTTAILRAVERSDQRSTLFWWLVEHYDEMVAAAKRRRISWGAFCAQAAKRGLTDTRGQPPSEANARKTWSRARAFVVRERTEAAAKSPARPGSTYPSRISKEWRPSGFLEPASAKPGGQLAVQSTGFRPPPIDDGRPAERPPMTHEEQMEFLKGGGPRSPPLPQDAESQIRRLRGAMNLRSGRPWDDPGDYVKKP